MISKEPGRGTLDFMEVPRVRDRDTGHRPFASGETPSGRGQHDLFTQDRESARGKFVCFPAYEALGFPPAGEFAPACRGESVGVVLTKLCGDFTEKPGARMSADTGEQVEDFRIAWGRTGKTGIPSATSSGLFLLLESCIDCWGNLWADRCVISGRVFHPEIGASRFIVLAVHRQFFCPSRNL